MVEPAPNPYCNSVVQKNSWLSCSFHQGESEALETINQSAAFEPEYLCLSNSAGIISSGVEVIERKCRQTVCIYSEDLSLSIYNKNINEQQHISSVSDHESTIFHRSEQVAPNLFPARVILL